MSALALLCALAAAPTSSRAAELVDLAGQHPRYLFDLRYATADNFFGRKVYPEGRCLLRRAVAEKVLAAQRWLDGQHPGLRLMFKDCYRPKAVQEVLWAAVKGTKQQGYVADPKKGSVHSLAAAVDVTLADAAGRELDMGTPYDHLGPEAEPRREERYRAAGRLTAAQLENRRMLREALVGAGMVQLPHEWWHYDDAPGAEVRRRWAPLDVPFSAVPRPRAID